MVPDSPPPRQARRPASDLPQGPGRTAEGVTREVSCVCVCVCVCVCACVCVCVGVPAHPGERCVQAGPLCTPGEKHPHPEILSFTAVLSPAHLHPRGCAPCQAPRAPGATPWPKRPSGHPGQARPRSAPQSALGQQAGMDRPQAGTGCPGDQGSRPGRDSAGHGQDARRKPRVGPRASRGRAGWLGDWAAEGHPRALAGGTLAQPPAAAAEAAFGRSRQRLPSPVLTRAALPDTAIIARRNRGPERPQSAMATDTVRGPQAPRPASARGRAPPASGPGLRPGEEPAPWTERGHASKTAPKLELEGPSAPPPPPPS